MDMTINDEAHFYSIFFYDLSVMRKTFTSIYDNFVGRYRFIIYIFVLTQQSGNTYKSIPFQIN